MEITELVKKTGLTYLMGETCYYYPCAMFCREAYSQGKFGGFIYGASQYYHHIDYIGYGKNAEERGMPPMLYPTHSTGMLLSAVNSYVKKVVCFGYEDKSGDDKFGAGKNIWDNSFSSQFALMQLAGGGTARITEGRSFGWMKPSSYISSLCGTTGGYEFSNAQHIFVEQDKSCEKEKVILTDVSGYVNPEAMVLNSGLEDFKSRVANGEWQWDNMSKIQEKEAARLPEEYTGLPNGHMTTHQFLIDDFCTAAYLNKIPALNAWAAARYTIPGLVAIESAKRGGITLDVPDCGDVPK